MLYFFGTYDIIFTSIGIQQRILKRCTHDLIILKGEFFMKKQIFALAALASFTMSATAFAARPTVVKVGGEEIESDVAPQIINNRTFVPLRAIFEALDIAVDYDAATKTITAKGADKTFELTIGSNIVKVNGEEKQIDAPAIIKDNRTLVPLRACAESFGFEVDWNDKTRVAKVKKGVWLLSKFNNHGIITTYQYDKNGNLTYEDYNGSGTKYEYDENDNQTYRSSVDGSWTKYEFNEFGEKIYMENPNGYWDKYTYDENGNMTYSEDSTGTWNKYTYDKNNNLTYRESSYNWWEKYTYGENNNLIYREYSDGKWDKYTYDENGNKTYEESSDGSWRKYTYDESGNLTYEESSNGAWTKCTYDENNNLTYSESSGGAWGKYIYDENGNMISWENCYGKNGTAEYIYIVR